MAAPPERGWLLVAEQVVHHPSSLTVHRRRDMRVDIERDGDRRVAEHVADDSRVNTLAQQKAGGRVPRVVKPDRVRDAGEQLQPAPALPIASLPTASGHRVGKDGVPSRRDHDRIA
jgi:hypothetical protein